MSLQFDDLTREDRLNFLQSPVWSKFRENLQEKRVELYYGIVDENTPVAKVKSKADKLAIIDEMFAMEKELIESLNIKGEINE